MEQTFKTRVASLESSCTDAAVATELTASGLAAVLSRLESVEARCAAGRLEALERHRPTIGNRGQVSCSVRLLNLPCCP